MEVKIFPYRGEGKVNRLFPEAENVDAGVATPEKTAVKKVVAVMHREVLSVTPGMTLEEAVRVREKIGAGPVPVMEKRQLIGTVTDSYLMGSVHEEGGGEPEYVRDVMTLNIVFCYEDETLDTVRHAFRENNVQRLLVLSRDRQLVGIVAPEDLSGLEGA